MAPAARPGDTVASSQRARTDNNAHWPTSYSTHTRVHSGNVSPPEKNQGANLPHGTATCRDGEGRSRHLQPQRASGVKELRGKPWCVRVRGEGHSGGRG
jgi:hypothetical protein